MTTVFLIACLLLLVVLVLWLLVPSLYGLPWIPTRERRIRRALQLRPGSRVVSIAADFPGWQPETVDREMLIFVYRMPAVRRL